MLLDCSPGVTKTEKNGGGTGLKVDFFTGEKSLRWNRLFISRCLNGFLEVNDYRAINMVFILVTGFIDLAPRTV